MRVLRKKEKTKHKFTFRLRERQQISRVTDNRVHVSNVAFGFIDTAVDLKKKGLLGNPIFTEAEYIHDRWEYFDKTPWRKLFD